MDIKFFDANCMIGQRLSENKFESGDILLKHMDNYGIDKALIFHSLAKENYLDEGNGLTLSESSKSDRLVPCWVVMPHYTGESPNPEVLSDRMRDGGVKAVRIFPVHHKINLYTWIWHDLFSRLEDLRIPVLVDFSNISWSQQIDWDGVNNICREHKNLPIILLRQGQVADRYLYYLLDKHDNLYLETSYYQVVNGIYSLVERFGAERMVFGTGMPFYDPNCPINALLSSGISEKNIRLIASENLENILNRVEY